MPKRQIVCQTCGASVSEPGMFCSAGTDLICQGRDFIPPCGATLTADERHWYGACCERCEREWYDRIETWRRGGQDTLLDEIFGAPARVLQ